MSRNSPQALFEDAKAYLQTTNENGKSIYDMLLEIVTYLQEHKDTKEINLKKLLEQLSEDGFKHGERSGIDELWKLSKPYPDSCNKAREIVDILLKQQETMKQEFSKRRQGIEELNKKKEDAENEEEPAEENPDVKYLYSNPEGVSNLIEDFYAFGLVGIGLPQEEISKLQIAVHNLKLSKKLSCIRFVGKILGIESHYYVFESNYFFEEKQPEDTIHESGGKPGLNRFTYWVLRSKDSLNNFTKLPDVTPKQINAARHISKLFTGTLTKEIVSYPPFPGNEANYLRAQIARIVHATTISPTDLFEERELPQPEEEEEEDKKKKKEIKYKEVLPPPVKVKEGFELKDPESMKSLENWYHLYPGIMKSGYVTKEIREGEEPVDPEDDKDPQISSFKLLQEDEGLKSCKDINSIHKKKPQDDEDEGDGENKETKIACWKVTLSNTRKQTCHHKSFKVAMLSSLRWPGAHTFYRNIGPICHFGSVYIGYGVKSTGIPYTPLLPPKVVDDLREPLDQVDPKPNDAKRMLQGLEPTSEDKPEEENEENEEGGDDEEDDE